MATDYAKKTVADLTEILKSRSLPHSGKKAELVARLTEDDKNKNDQVAAEAPAAAASAPAAQSNIAEPIPTQQPTLAKPIDPVDAPAAPAPPAPSTNPSGPTNSVPDTSSAATTTTTTAIEPPSYAANLSSSTLESELEKRKARAARFGLPSDSTANESEKALQRAQRFGAVDTNGAGVGRLDQALPERERRRGGGGGGGKFSRGGGGGGGRNRGGRGNTPGRVGEKGDVQKPQTKSFVSEQDRSAAEARLKRFAAT